MKQRKVWLIRFGELKVFFRRLFVVLLFLTAFLTILLSRVDSLIVSAVDKVIIDVTGPVMQVLEFPARTMHQAYTYFYDISHIYAENKQLRSENKQMMILQNKVRTLEVENQLLARLLNYVPPQEVSYMSARIIAESGDSFAHLLLVYIGDEAVRKGQVVLSNESVIGRVDTVGEHFAKIILITDINSRIPVLIERTRARGILSGNNTAIPEMIFTRSNADIQVGDVVVTSGVGGLFPSGLPIGFISAVNEDGSMKVEPMADISRLEYVRIVDYGLAGENEFSEDFTESNDAK